MCNYCTYPVVVANTMDREFFQRKIKELTDDKLLDLFYTTRINSNNEIHQLTVEEIKLRDLVIDQNYQPPGQVNLQTEIGDLKNLSVWNWGAFALGPIWTLANRLEMWTLLLFIPFVNIIVLFHLGYNGNRIAYKKSGIRTVDDFMIVQKLWNRWGYFFFWFWLFGGLLIGCLQYAWKN